MCLQLVVSYDLTIISAGKNSLIGLEKTIVWSKKLSSVQSHCLVIDCQYDDLSRSGVTFKRFPS